MPEDAFIGSEDVIALDPSIDMEEATIVVGKMVEKSDVEIEGIDYKKIGMYLTINKEREELEGDEMPQPGAGWQEADADWTGQTQNEYKQEMA